MARLVHGMCKKGAGNVRSPRLVDGAEATCCAKLGVSRAREDRPKPENGRFPFHCTVPRHRGGGHSAGPSPFVGPSKRSGSTNTRRAAHRADAPRAEPRRARFSSTHSSVQPPRLCLRGARHRTFERAPMRPPPSLPPKPSGGPDRPFGIPTPHEFGQDAAVGMAWRVRPQATPGWPSRLSLRNFAPCSRGGSLRPRLDAWARSRLWHVPHHRARTRRRPRPRRPVPSRPLLSSHSRRIPLRPKRRSAPPRSTRSWPMPAAALQTSKTTRAAPLDSCLRSCSCAAA